MAEVVNTLDELERLLAAAAPGPWEVIRYDNFAEVDATVDGKLETVSEGMSFADADLSVALRNAAPALLALARAVARYLPLAEDANELMSVDAWIREADARCELADALAALRAPATEGA